MESSTRRRLARVSMATVAIAVAATTIASATDRTRPQPPRRSQPPFRRPDPRRREGRRRRTRTQRHPADRRRHGRLRDHHRPQLRQGRCRTLRRHRRPAADRAVHHLLARPRTGKPDYDPDSAATGTAWATGTKTYDGAISVDVHGQAAADPARAGEGAAACAPATSPPPRSRTPPRPSRSRTSPRAPATARARRSTTCPRHALENGGLGSITEQIIDTRPDVTLGGGATTFDETATAGDVRGQDAQAAGHRARLPARHRQGRPRQAVTQANQDQAAARPVRHRQHAGALGRPRGDRGRRQAGPRRRAPPTPTARPPSPRWPT